MILKKSLEGKDFGQKWNFTGVNSRSEISAAAGAAQLHGLHERPDCRP